MWGSTVMAGSSTSTLSNKGDVMAFDWSEHAPVIQSLFRHWHAGDGYSEAELDTTEASLGFRLPEILRRYYAA